MFVHILYSQPIHTIVFTTDKGTQDIPSVVLDELKLLRVCVSLHTLCSHHHHFHFRLSSLHKEVAVFIDDYLNKNSGVFTPVMLSVQASD